MKTVDISGFGGGYENACQAMLKAGLEFISDSGLPEEKEFEEPRSERVIELEKVMIKATNNDCTGAMFYTTLGHIINRSKNEDEYFKKFEDSPDRVYEWDGTANSIPAPKI